MFIIFLYRYYYLLFIVHEYWEFNPYISSCHPLITYCIYIETVCTYNIHRSFTTSNISCPSISCIALKSLCLHILLRSIL
nr:MAG TPA: hypothetical protein [Bacteriophage sp.]